MSIIASLFFRSRTTNLLKRYRKEVARISALEEQVGAMSSEAIRARVEAIRQELAGGSPLAHRAEIFALVREMSKRVLGLRHHDVQLMGGMALSEGRLAEMKTGEGKTLVVALAASLMALSGRGVHVVTVNEYLAKRDAEEMRPLYDALGLSVGLTLSGMAVEAKQAGYRCDITYGVNHEFGFDYLRDNMVHDLAMRTQRGRVCAIIDEVDSILIDEARTPLIISGQAKHSGDIYLAIDQVVRGLRPDEHFEVCEKKRQSTLTELGFDLLEKRLVAHGVLPHEKALYSPEHLSVLKHVNAALLAHTLYLRDHRYVVQDGTIVVVDDATGRLMPGRRWPDGLHEAVEAKEGVTIQPETQTQATITYQNYYTHYELLCGLTGTAMTEADEFREIYNLDPVSIPTHRPVIREDRPDLMFRTKAAKYVAIVRDVKARQDAGQPVLIGTGSVEESELLSGLLERAGVPHSVLNAKQNGQEAAVIAQAGLPGAVTVATNMAGRGTDILLGGNWKATLPADASEVEVAAAKQLWEARHAQVMAAGGLCVIGTERHESRRVDNQLRGRAGRQGDPGASQFYLSLEDTLLRVFASGHLDAALKHMKADGEAVDHPWLARLVQSAQKKLENQGFSARRDVMKFDNVFASQRNAVYSIRDELLAAEDIDAIAMGRIEQALARLLEEEALANPLAVDAAKLTQRLEAQFGVTFPVAEWLDDELEAHEVQAKVMAVLAEKYAALRATYSERWSAAVQHVLLATLDDLWVSHLTELDALRQSIGLRAVAQQNPVFQFAKEGFALFEQFMNLWAAEASRLFFMPAEQPSPSLPTHTPAAGPLRRNAPCPCASGLRFKHCCGKLS